MIQPLIIGPESGYVDDGDVFTTQDSELSGRIIMKNIFVVFVLAYTAGFSANSNAVTVKGMESCEAWTRNHAAPSLNAKIDSAWLAGYLSGVAVARDIDFLKGVDDSTIKSWMDNYCHRHPQDLIGYAADALSVELNKRMH